MRIAGHQVGTGDSGQRVAIWLRCSVLLVGFMVAGACCAQWNKFHAWSGRYLPLLQDAGGCARSHASRDGGLAVLTAEEITAHGVTGGAPCFIDHLGSDCVIRLRVLDGR